MPLNYLLALVNPKTVKLARNVPAPIQPVLFPPLHPVVSTPRVPPIHPAHPVHALLEDNSKMAVAINYIACLLAR